MRHVFLDSSVLLAFSRSTTGASAFIIQCCEQGKLKGYISEKVVSEIQKNTQEDMGEEAIMKCNYVLGQNFLIIVQDPSEEELEKANNAFENPKDTPILAAAKQISHLQYILSLDNGFFKPEVLAYIQPLEVLKPGEFLKRFRSELEIY